MRFGLDRAFLFDVRENVAFVAEPDEVIGILSHIPYHLQEVRRVLSNCLSKGQTLSTYVESEEKQRNEKKRQKTQIPQCELKGSADSSQLSRGTD